MLNEQTSITIVAVSALILIGIVMTSCMQNDHTRTMKAYELQKIKLEQGKCN